MKEGDFPLFIFYSLQTIRNMNTNDFVYLPYPATHGSSLLIIAHGKNDLYDIPSSQFEVQSFGGKRYAKLPTLLEFGDDFLIPTGSCLNVGNHLSVFSPFASYIGCVFHEIDAESKNEYPKISGYGSLKKYAFIPAGSVSAFSKYKVKTQVYGLYPIKVGTDTVILTCPLSIEELKQKTNAANGLIHFKTLQAAPASLAVDSTGGAFLFRKDAAIPLSPQECGRQGLSKVMLETILRSWNVRTSKITV